MRRIPEGQVTSELQCPSAASMFRLAAVSEESGRVRREQAGNGEPGVTAKQPDERS